MKWSPAFDHRALSIRVLALAVMELALWASLDRLGLALSWPGVQVQMLFWLASLPVGILALRYGVERRSGTRSARRFELSVFTIGVALGFLVLCVRRPDADDVGYLHFPLLDAANLAMPATTEPWEVVVGGTLHALPGLVARDAYEGMVVATATAWGLDPLVAYHNLFAFLAALLWATVYAALFRRFRLSRRESLVAIVGTAVFLLLDGNLHRSFGNFAFVRLWQGKVIAYALLLPLLLLALMELLARPTTRRLLRVVLVGGVGLAVNRAMTFLVPFSTVAITGAWLGSFGLRRHRERVFSFLFPAAVLSLPGVFALAIWRDSGPPIPLASIGEALGDTLWWTSYRQLLFGSPWIPIRDLFLLLVVPWFAVSRPLARLLPALASLLLVLCFAPGTAALWFQLAETVSWRLYFLLPVPLCAGLATTLFLPRSGAVLPPRGSRALVGFLALLATGLAFERSTLSPANGTDWKTPLELRFDPVALDFAREAGPRLKGEKVLALDRVANVLALLHPGDPELVYTRDWGKPVERLVGHCRVTPSLVEDARGYLLTSQAVIVGPCGGRVVAAIASVIAPRRLSEETLGTMPRLYRLYRILDVEEAATSTESTPPRS